MGHFQLIRCVCTVKYILTTQETEIAGFRRFRNIIEQVELSNEEETKSLLEVRNVKTFAPELNQPSQHVDARLRFVLDETPVLPDTPLVKSYTTLNAFPLSK